MRTRQPDYITWLALMNDLVDHAELVEGSVYVDENGRTRGRFELPGELFLGFSIRDNEYDLSLRNLKTLLDEGSPFSELSARMGFEVGANGVERADGQVMFRDYTYEGLERQTLGHLYTMDRYTLEITELTQRANPEQKGSWIYAPGQKKQITFSDLKAADRWYQVLRKLKKED